MAKCVCESSECFNNMSHCSDVFYPTRGPSLPGLIFQKTSGTGPVRIQGRDRWLNAYGNQGVMAKRLAKTPKNARRKPAWHIASE
jgi:hypothetical protein